MEMLKGAFREPGVIITSSMDAPFKAPISSDTTFFEEIFMRATKIETPRGMIRSKIKKLPL